jgi:hypothetical protein
MYFTARRLERLLLASASYARFQFQEVIFSQILITAKGTADRVIILSDFLISALLLKSS